MNSKVGRWIVILALGLIQSIVAGDNLPIVRQQQTLVIDGQKEEWQLRWQSKPTPVCNAEEADMAFTCPCAGFAYGEQGKLTLQRISPHGNEEMNLSTLFDNDLDGPQGRGVAALRRWNLLQSDMDTLLDEQRAAAHIAKIKKRPLANVMQFGDYLHDKLGATFLLQVGVMPCGHIMSVLIGISAQKRKLHAIGTALHPDKPLILEKRIWEALRKSKGSVRSTAWACGDHGSEQEEEIELSIGDSGITATTRLYACTKEDKRGKLMSTEIM